MTAAHKGNAVKRHTRLRLVPLPDEPIARTETTATPGVKKQSHSPKQVLSGDPVKSEPPDASKPQGAANGTIGANSGKRGTGSSATGEQQSQPPAESDNAAAPGRHLFDLSANINVRSGSGDPGDLPCSSRVGANGHRHAGTGDVVGTRLYDSFTVTVNGITFYFGTPPLTNDHIEYVVKSTFCSKHGRHPNSSEWHEIRLSLAHAVMSWARKQSKNN